MVPGQIFYYIGPHLGPWKYRMELSFMSETFFTHGPIYCSFKSVKKIVGSYWEHTILGTQRTPKSAKIGKICHSH